METNYNNQIDELCGHFGKAEIVPVVTRMPGDLLTPLAAFCALSDGSERSFLFESVEGGEHLARYSFLGAGPYLSVRETENGLVTRRGDNEEPVEGAILDFLKTRLSKRSMPEIKDLPYFPGGAVGFLDYEIARQIEPVLDVPGSRKPGRAGSEFLFFRRVVAFDHVKQTINIVSLVFAEDAKGDREIFRELVAEALDENRQTAKMLSAGGMAAQIVSRDADECPAFGSNFSRPDFESSVEEIKELIAAGECYQVVLSQRFSRKTKAEPLEIYRALRSLNPSPYMFLLQLGDRAVVGASPEMLVRCRDRKLEYRPIAGTRPRGRDAARDEALAAEMLADEKELAEHRMLVDLGRNDLGRVAEYGSVTVDELMNVEKFSHVQHIVSSVSARLREGLDGYDALASCFPAGTVTGAPKVRAMEIIERLEPTARGVYSGAVGYFDHQGNFDTCIAIRTVYLENGIASIQAGAGIVADSVPSREFDETVHKAKALITAVEMAESGQFSVSRAPNAGEGASI